MGKIEFKIATIEDAPVIFSLLEKLSQDLDKENEMLQKIDFTHIG